MRRIAISGVVALAAALGGIAVPVTAMAAPTAVVRPDSAAVVRPANAVRAAMRMAPMARTGEVADALSGQTKISCVLATDCLGVEGSSALTDDGPATPTRVARWNGSSWKGVGVALPKGTKSVDLNGVSCKGAKSCLVVGDYYTSTSQNAPNRMLALTYNGTSLKPTPAVPLPKGTTVAALASVSCATTRYCVALGVAEGHTAAFGNVGSLNLIETWNGAKWTLHTAAATIGKTTFVEPTVVSCASSAFCVLAGESVPIISSGAATSSASTLQLYVASWNGKKLTTMKPTAVGGAAAFPVPTGISCATASNCAVTGASLGGISSSGAPTFTAFTEIWNGRAWQLGKVTWPAAAAQSFTLGVSCYGAHSCEAVGEDFGNAETSPAYAAAVSFNGAVGTLQTVPAPSKGDSNAFAAVSCLPWGSCVATGETGKTTGSSFALMTGVWNGKAWKLDPGF